MRTVAPLTSLDCATVYLPTDRRFAGEACPAHRWADWRGRPLLGNTYQRLCSPSCFESLCIAE